MDECPGRTFSVVISECIAFYHINSIRTNLFCKWFLCHRWLWISTSLVIIEHGMTSEWKGGKWKKKTKQNVQNKSNNKKKTKQNQQQKNCAARIMNHGHTHMDGFLAIACSRRPAIFLLKPSKLKPAYWLNRTKPEAIIQTIWKIEKQQQLNCAFPY